MADIDKALPNEPRKTVNLPGEEEIQETLVEEVEKQIENEIKLILGDDKGKKIFEELKNY